jgi:hypothetical protein
LNDAEIQFEEIADRPILATGIDPSPVMGQVVCYALLTNLASLDKLKMVTLLPR